MGIIWWNFATIKDKGCALCNPTWILASLENVPVYSWLSAQLMKEPSHMRRKSQDRSHFITGSFYGNFQSFLFTVFFFLSFIVLFYYSNKFWSIVSVHFLSRKETVDLILSLARISILHNCPRYSATHKNFDPEQNFWSFCCVFSTNERAVSLHLIQ